jgi:hypothetical protein
VTKHGHVTPNPDGSKARCGGPRICPVCAFELAEQSKNQKVSKLADIGQAKHQRVSPEVVGGTVEELEREIGRLQKQNDELTKALRWILQDLEARHLADSMSHSIYTSASRALGYPVGKVGKPMLPDWDKETADLVQQNENQARTIRVLTETVGRLEEVTGHAEEPLVVDMKEVPAFKRYRVTRLTKEGARCEWTLGLRNYVVTLPICVAEALTHLFPNTPQSPPICPVEPPMPTLTANVPREAVGEHEAAYCIERGNRYRKEAG